MKKMDDGCGLQKKRDCSGMSYIFTIDTLKQYLVSKGVINEATYMFLDDGEGIE